MFNSVEIELIVQVIPSHLFRSFIPQSALHTIGNCQRLAFIVGVSQHMHKITNL